MIFLTRKYKFSGKWACGGTHYFANEKEVWSWLPDYLISQESSVICCLDNVGRLTSPPASLGSESEDFPSLVSTFLLSTDIQRLILGRECSRHNRTFLHVGKCAATLDFIWQIRSDFVAEHWSSNQWETAKQARIKGFVTRCFVVILVAAFKRPAVHV